MLNLSNSTVFGPLAIVDPPRRIIARLYSLTEAVEGKPKYFQGRHEPVPPYRNIEPVYGINKDFGGNQNAKRFQLKRGCQTVACKFYNGRETIDTKAVVNHSQSSSVIISDNCNELDVSNEHRSDEALITVYRLTVRKVGKQSKIDRHLHLRDRRLSRIPLKKVLHIMRKRKLRRKCKVALKKSIPPSSRLFYLISNGTLTLYTGTCILFTPLIFDFMY